MRAFYALCLAAVAFVCAVISSHAADEGPLSGTFTDWSRHPAIVYASQDTHDPVAELSRKVRDGRVSLARDGKSGFLRSVLDALNVPVESQIMIFNPDSVQGRRINPANPRSLFFNDQVSVGWVRGGFIELASQDPRQGVVFYQLQDALIGQPYFVRRDDCLTCHYSYSTVGVPGMLARSSQQYSVTHALRLDRRWGGWYVTGNVGAAQHLGNIDIKRILEGAPPSDLRSWPSLGGKFDLDGYLTPHSDVVALMVFEHQMRMMNLLSRIGYEARIADYRRGKTDAQLRETGDDPGDKTVALDQAAREVADYMLFVDEAPLPNAIKGSTAFAERFAARGPRDGKGRSLRDFDLQKRLFRYPLSYMIYSPQFDALPASAKHAIYSRLVEGLSRRSADDRKAILEILRATKPDALG